MEENRESCPAINGIDSNTDSSQNADSNNNNESRDGQRVMQPQDVHTRERLFDFIALLQGRRMDDQRAILKPSNTT